MKRELTPPSGWQSPGYNRLAPLRSHEANFVQRVLIRLINYFGKLDASNLFMTLIRNTRLFRSWLGFAAKLMPYGRLDRVDTELVILRVGWNCRARYEWGQHVDIGLRAGLTPEQIARIPEGPTSAQWSEKQAALLSACDELHKQRMVAETTWETLKRHFSESEIIELLMLIGHYEMLAGVLNSVGLPLDDKLEAILAAAPIHAPERSEKT